MSSTLLELRPPTAGEDWDPTASAVSVLGEIDEFDLEWELERFIAETLDLVGDSHEVPLIPAQESPTQEALEPGPATSATETPQAEQFPLGRWRGAGLTTWPRLVHRSGSTGLSGRTTFAVGNLGRLSNINVGATGLTGRTAFAAGNLGRLSNINVGATGLTGRTTFGHIDFGGLSSFNPERVSGAPGAVSRPVGAGLSNSAQETSSGDVARNESRTPEAPPRYPNLARALQSGRVRPGTGPDPAKRPLRVVPEPTELSEDEQISFGLAGSPPSELVRRPR